MMGSAPYGGSDIGELHKIGQLLKGKAPEDDDAWFDACAKVADGVRAHAEKFEGGGHRFSAAHAYLRACNYYQMAERFRTPKDEKALAAFRTGVQCFHRHAKLTDVKIEIVEVPFEGGKPAGLLRPCAERAIEARAVRRVLRRPRRHQGDPVHARRARSHQARHFGAGDGRPRHR